MILTITMNKLHLTGFQMTKFFRDLTNRVLPSEEHYHTDSQGFLVKCYHKVKPTFLSISFWLGVTLSFPIEHFIWEHVWPFAQIAAVLGLIH